MDNDDPLTVTRKFEGDLRSSAADVAPPKMPDTIGRYRIVKLLGKGGFGLVYLALDEQLHRSVAIKVPHSKLVARPEDAELYLTEARTVASLEHPHIVPVYDVGSTMEFPFFVVSKYVEGTDLATKLKESGLSCQQAAELVATVAEALHYAHKRGFVHRDVKPGNILIDSEGSPHIVDFGLALREENIGKGPKYAGTPAYMSPEQARGEGHRVDGRSDIFSLGVVFYELLVGRQPFRGDTQIELLEQITTQEPRPPRQIDDHIPKELDRICLKALSKRASERYSAARDMAEDLRHFLAEQALNQQSCHAEKGSGSPAVVPVLQPLSTSIASSRSGGTSATATTPSSDSQPIKIVPKGLRSFDAHDADFFLELLPGPRDRDGLPDSIRLWKTRIEESDRDNTLSVGLIYGPSGCGKSSLVKAGLLPRLSEDVIAVYVESTAEETETRVLNGLRKRCAALSDNLSLKETMAALRRGQGIPVGKKVLIILDQFEQWLHAKRNEENTDLVQALRQCDGERVQCIVMVRDDFWMAVTGFLADLDVRLVEGHNSAAVHLFDLRHAEKVLAAFGRAFGVLPESSREVTKDEKHFLQQAVNGLAQDGKVVCVRLALFAEMMKGKPWTPAALKEVGGTEGIGVTFLEETFSASTAPPEHRFHQKAARAVLKALLPESGTDIKGHMRSRHELMKESGSIDRPQEFDALIGILDNEVRLITPTDPEGVDPDAPNTNIQTGHRYYQLTHDYLVHSLRDWLTRKQKETRRGRAELRLADRAALWNAKPESRLLPSLWEYLNIRLLNDRKKWTVSQQKMMRKAGRVHGTRCGIAAVVAVAALFSAWEINGHFQAASLVKRLAAADITEVPGIFQELGAYRRWADPLLRQEDAKAAQGSNKKLHLDLALLPVDESKIAELRDDLPLVSPSQFPVVRDALLSYKDSVVEPLWNVSLNSKRDVQQRFQGACALATYAPDDNRWSRINTLVTARLVTLEASAFVAWREALRPAMGQLIMPLALIYRDTKQKEQSRSFATEMLADYATDRPDELFDLLADAEQFQFPVLFAKLTAYKDKAVALADQELARKPPEKASEDQKEVLAKRQANAAVALLRLGTPEQVWPLLKFSPDPRVRSYVIHWLSPLGGDPPQPIIQRLNTEPDVTIRRALVLALGEFTETQLSSAQRKPLIEKLLAVYENEPDAGLHGAVEWLLRKWGQGKRLEAVAEKLKNNEQQLQARKSNDKRRWFINTQKQTFVIVDGGEFLMGSPQSEADRFPNEPQHRRRIGRRFAIATTEVTKEQFGRFQTAQPENVKRNMGRFVRTDDSPQLSMKWYEAAAYCDWLSEREGIPKEQWCYERNKQGKYATGMKAKDKFWELTGYRLPTEAEWEYACRAGTVTSRYYGLTESLLAQYAWYQVNGQNRARPVGGLKPNDLGLFDMLGNVGEWCFGLNLPYPEQADKVFEDTPTTQPVEAADTRMLRGGAWGDLPEGVRSADRNSYGPDLRAINFGFRPARTYP